MLLADVSEIDLDARTVGAAAPGGEPLELGYDTLIVAAGATHSYLGHDQWAGVAPGLKTLEDARTVRARVLGAFEMAELAADPAEREAWLRFAVIGGGPTGIELSGQIAELAHGALRPDYRAVDPAEAEVALLEAGSGVLADYPETLQRRAVRDLGAMGVAVNLDARATGIDPEGVDVAGEDGVERRFPARTVIWAAGVAASPLARTLADAGGAELDGTGRLEVHPDLSLPGHPEVLAIGDMVALDGVPGIAPAAMQQGRYAAKAVRTRLAGREAGKPFAYFDKGTLAVIGRRRAVGTSFGVRFTGLVAILVWALVHVRFLVGWGNRLVTVVRWMWSLLARNRGDRVIPLTDLSRTVRRTPSSSSPQEGPST